MRTRTLLLSALVVTIVTIWIGGLAAGGSPPDGSADPPASGSPDTRASVALAALRNWDRRRSAAWSRADPAGLAALYTRGSRTARRDVADLERWRRRGLRVVGLRQQVSALRPLSVSADRLVVLVTDRTVGGIAVGHGRRTPLPVGAWATQRISLVHADGWQVVEARAGSGG